jgi:ParB-like chromosome segregation protein Spo0J
MSLEQAEDFIASLAKTPVEERIAIINRLIDAIQAIHPNNDPVSGVKWVPASIIEANSYNPNSVMPPEMRLLYISIKEDGYTQPIVVFWDEERKKYIVVDGFHRNLVGKEYRDIRERTHGYLPIVIIKKSLAERIASTIRHNRARGKHVVLGMVYIVEELVKAGLSDAQIGKQLGMSADEVLRLKTASGNAALFENLSSSQGEDLSDHVQTSGGIPELFRHRSYSRSWIPDPEGQEDASSKSDGQKSKTVSEKERES